jgi:hypothetical protein
VLNIVSQSPAPTTLLHADPTTTTLDTAFLSEHLALDIASERAGVFDKLDGDPNIDAIIVDATTVDTTDCKRVLREFADRDAAVLLVTGADPDPGVLQLGADAHLSAPIDAETVVGTVERLRERAGVDAGRDERDGATTPERSDADSEDRDPSAVSTAPIYRRYPREFYGLWFLAAITYGFGDIVSTALAVLGGSGIAEANPLVAGVLASYGLPGFLVVKFVILVALLWISVDGARSSDRFSYYWPPLVATLLGGALTGWNLWLLYGSG